MIKAHSTEAGQMQRLLLLGDGTQRIISPGAVLFL